MAQDSSRPQFWDTRFREGVTPWDAGGAPPKLARWLRGKPKMNVLVPGCGTGYEVRLLAEQGHDVLGIDFSDAALDAARARGVQVRKADFFALNEGRFDLIYERAFLCALPRPRWPDWARRMAELVRPGGQLAGFFYMNDNERGPPFGTDRATLDRLLGDPFALAEDEAVPPGESIPVFQGREIWQVRKRRL